MTSLEEVVFKITSEGFNRLIVHVKKLDRATKNYSETINNKLNKSLAKNFSSKMDLANEKTSKAGKDMKANYDGLTEKSKKFSKQEKWTRKTLRGGANDLLKNADHTNELEKRHNSFGRALLMSNDNLNKFVKGGGEFSKRSARWGHKLRMFTTGLRGFKMEMLGIMFFGMAMQRMFSGILKPATQLVGLFDLWRTTLQILFLPMALLIMDFLMPIFMWLMNLSDSTKLFIGKLVLLGAGIGLLLFVVGTLALGVGALIMLFSSMFNIIDDLTPDIQILGINMSSFVEASLGITLVSKAFTFFKKVITGTLNKLLEFKIIKEMFSKFKVVIDDTKTPLENFKTLFGTVIDNIKEKLGISGEDGEGGFLSNFITTFEEKVAEMQTKVKEQMLDMGITGEGGLIESFGDMTETISGMTPTLDSLAASLSTIADALTAIFNGWNKVKTSFSNASDFGGRVGDTLKTSAYGSLPSNAQYIRDAEKKGLPGFNDFLMRPGQSPIGINPNDTVVGFKGNSPFGQGVSITQNITITGSMVSEIKKIIDETNTTLINKLQMNLG